MKQKLRSMKENDNLIIIYSVYQPFT